MSTVKYYDTKQNALENLTNKRKLLCNRNITKFFLLDNYNTFIKFITRTKKPDFYECINSNVPVCFFYDIEIYKSNVDPDINPNANSDSDSIVDQKTEEISVGDIVGDIIGDIVVEEVNDNTPPDYYYEYNKIIDVCIDKITELVESQYHGTTSRKIILESHSQTKRSFHIILRFFKDDKEIVFENVNALKRIYKKFHFDQYRDTQNKHIIDPSVYREGLFRTIYSSKPNENRPIVKCDQSDDFEDIETFICHISSDEYIIFDEQKIQDEIPIEDKIQKLVVNIPEELDNNDKATLRKFVQREFHHFPNRIRDVFIDKSHNCIIISLMERYCPFLDKEHRGNNQYIVIDTCSAKQKCHNQECNEDKYNEIKLENYPKEVNEIIKKCLKVNQEELALIDHAIIECKNYINENFDKDVKEVQFDRKEMIFRGNVSDKSLVAVLKGKCPECNVEHQISDNGYCLKCKVCAAVFPKKSSHTSR